VSSTLQRPALPYIAPPCSPMAPSPLPPAPSLLPLKRPCPLSRTETAIPNPKFGVYIMYIYIYTSQQTSPLSLLPPPHSLSHHLDLRKTPATSPTRSRSERMGLRGGERGGGLRLMMMGRGRVCLEMVGGGVALRLWIFDASGGKNVNHDSLPLVRVVL